MTDEEMEKLKEEYKIEVEKQAGIDPEARLAIDPYELNCFHCALASFVDRWVTAGGKFAPVRGQAPLIVHGMIESIAEIAEQNPQDPDQRHKDATAIVLDLVTTMNDHGLEIDIATEIEFTPEKKGTRH